MLPASSVDSNPPEGKRDPMSGWVRRVLVPHHALTRHAGDEDSLQRDHHSAVPTMELHVPTELKQRLLPT